MIEGYDDIPCDGLRDEWLREVPPEWQRSLMGVEPRLRIIRSNRTKRYLVIIRQSNDDPLHLEPFDDGEYLVRWMPVQWIDARANASWFVENIQRAQKLAEAEFGDFAPHRVAKALRERHQRRADAIKARSDQDLAEATAEAQRDLGTQRVTSAAGVAPGLNYWSAERDGRPMPAVRKTEGGVILP